MTKTHIKSILRSEYAITPGVFEKSAWGYNTTAYYVELGTKKYIAKVTDNTKQRLARCQKDVCISTLLSSVLPTPLYLKNKHGSYVTSTSGIIIRVAQYVEGTSPFNMAFPIYRGMLNYLKLLHQIPVEEYWFALKDFDFKVLEDTRTFLHGDLTPSNVIVSDDKVVGILDFEDSLLGPVEYDLARSAVFSWFRTKNTRFKEIFEFTLKNYSPQADKEKLLFYCVSHSQNHLDQVLAHKDTYTNKSFWNDDFNFSAKALKEIKALRI